MFGWRCTQDGSDIAQANTAQVRQLQTADGLRAMLKRTGSIISIAVRIGIRARAHAVEYYQNSSSNLAHSYILTCSSFACTGNGSPINGNA